MKIGIKDKTLSRPALVLGFTLINLLTMTAGPIIAQTSGPVPSDTLRVHYNRADEDYTNQTLWVWEDTTWTSPGWPEGMPVTGNTNGGVYYDVPLAANAALVSFIVVDRTLGDSGRDGDDKSFRLLDRYNEVWIRQGDNNVYISANLEQAVELVSSTVVGDRSIQITFNTTTGLDVSTLGNFLSIRDRNGTTLAVDGFTAQNDGQTVIADLALDFDAAPYSVSYDGLSSTAYVSWPYIDGMYAYDGPLGAELHEDGTATLRVWSPVADSVHVVVYDAADQDVIVVDDLLMTREDTGVWSITLNEANTGKADIKGHFYHYKITHGVNTNYCVDPYAQSMAPFDSARHAIGKAAIIDVSTIGPELSYAEIDGWEGETDTIIWEIHTRDLTSDPDIEGELTAPFGTFEAVIDKLDYMQSLGVTHVQFLPIMSFFNGNELGSRTRELEYSAQGNNFNWGYDPHSYFSVSGMYSASPEDPEARIREFKNMIDAIHARGMGVILDVVYNHTARVRIFEDLVPNYYHFMDLNGAPRTSFGGGRLGTTHYMARRVMVDSIVYWTREFKVDGFRFDMMGDHDAESVQMAFDAAQAINPNVVMIGEGWRTFAGDEGDPRQPADQDWMEYTSGVAVFSDEFRNELKSGYGSEGEARFVTGGTRNIDVIFGNVKAQPTNFVADEPGDVVTYVAAHDNLPLHDVIAQSIRKDIAIPENEAEVHRRVRLANAMVLTSQGIAFLHAGQEYGRTKQWLADGRPEHAYTTFFDRNGQPFENPYFVHDSYDSTDIINRFHWAKVTDASRYPHHVQTKNFTKGLIALRRSTDAFTLPTKALVDSNVTLVGDDYSSFGEVRIAYRCEATNGDAYYVFINADIVPRSFSLDVDLTASDVLVDGNQSGTTAIAQPSGFTLTANQIEVEPLSVVVIKE
jgi:pullulanase